jgi:hypothetical protein
MRGAASLVAVACLSLAGFAQAPQPAASQLGSLGGVVVDGTTGEPLANVPVTTCALWQGPPRGQEAQTDSQGRFTFNGLPPGKYQICVKTHLIYLPERMRDYEVGPGEAARDVVKRVWRGASLDGRVVTERGGPAAGVRVSVLTPRVVAGITNLAIDSTASDGPVHMQSTTTDADGRFQFTDIPQGLVALMTSWTQISAPADAPPEVRSTLDPIGDAPCPTWDRSPCPREFAAGARWNQFVELVPQSAFPPHPADPGQAYVTQFTPSLDKNRPEPLIVLTAGEHRSNIELRLQPMRTFRVSGQLVGNDVSRNGLMLALESDDIPPMAAWRPLPAAVTLTDASGRFAFLRVPAGHYRIRSRTSPDALTANGAGEQLSVDMPVNVAGDLDDVAPTALRPVSLHGTIRFEGRSPPPNPTDAIQVFFVRADAAAGAGRLSSTIASGQTFRSGPLQPGEYLLGARFISARVAGGGEGTWRLKDAIVDGHDMTDLPVTIGAADLGNIAVTFTDVVRGEISGDVRDQGGKPDAEASVLIFSTDSRYWSHMAPWEIPARKGRAQVVLTSQLGSYEFPSLPAGEYFLAAVPDSDDAWMVIEYPNPELFAKLAPRAARVTVKDADRLVHDLQTLK